MTDHTHVSLLSSASPLGTDCGSSGIRRAQMENHCRYVYRTDTLTAEQQLDWYSASKHTKYFSINLCLIESAVAGGLI